MKAAAGLIRGAKLPLYGGMASDVAGARAVLSIADRTCGVLDHALSEGQYRNFRVVQTSGWIMSTLTEVRNRADLLLIVGTDVHKLHGRFFDRIVTNPHTMFESLASKRTVVFIGEGLDTSAAVGPRIEEVITLPVAKDRIPEVLAAISARVRGFARSAAGGARSAARQARWSLLSLYAEQRGAARPPPRRTRSPACRSPPSMPSPRNARKAKYGVMVWAPPALSMPQADLTVHLMTEVVRELNLHTRFAGLSLGGNEGAPSAASTCTWQTGFPLRVSFANGTPEYNSYRYNVSRMIDRGRGRPAALGRLDRHRHRPAADEGADHRAGHAGRAHGAAAHRLYPRRHAGHRPHGPDGPLRQRRFSTDEEPRPLAVAECRRRPGGH